MANFSRNQYVNYLIDCIGYREEEVENLSMQDMQFIIVDNGKTEDFLGYIS